MTRKRFVLLVCAALLALSGCDWPMAGFDPARTGYNPTESKISTANVATLQESWKVSQGGCFNTPAAVSGGYVYDTHCDFLRVYDAKGQEGCSGTPRTCQPVWRSTTGGECIPGCPLSTSAVGSGVVVFVKSGGVLQAYDAAGQTGCSGTPKTCQPLWTASLGGASSAPAIANGVVYVTTDAFPSGSRISAFDAMGTQNCSGSPKTCAPLWTAVSQEIRSAPAIADGVVYVGGQGVNGATGVLSAFDADGVENCSGAPVECAPLWQGRLDCMEFAGFNGCELSIPSVASGVVYVGVVLQVDLGTIGFTEGGLVAFDAAGVTNCAAPATCAPLWRMRSDAVFAAPAVANGVVYANTSGFFFDSEQSSGSGRLVAVDATGTTNCSGVPKTCAPLWTADGGSGGYPAVANGVVYFSDTVDFLAPSIKAVDASGSQNCSGTPKVCAPIWSVAGGQAASPVIARGVVYAPLDTTLTAYALP